MGQTRHFDRVPITSGLPQQADLLRVRRHVSNVPITEVAFVSKPIDGSVLGHENRRKSNDATGPSLPLAKCLAGDDLRPVRLASPLPGGCAAECAGKSARS